MFKKKKKFFFKKFFYKNTFKQRYALTTLFFFKKRVRQKKLNKFISTFHNKNPHLFLFFVLLQTNLIFFKKDIFFFLRKGYVFVNNFREKNPLTLLTVGDCISFFFKKSYFFYFKFVKRFFKKKLLFNKKIRRLFFKKLSSKAYKNVFLKRKTSKIFNYFTFFRFRTPTYLELDYLTLTVFIVFFKKNYNFFFYKYFNFNFIKFLNWKKIN